LVRSSDVRTNDCVITSEYSEAKNSSSQRASSAVIRTTSPNGIDSTNAVAAFCPKLGPTHRSGSSPIASTARSANATELIRNAICVASEYSWSVARKRCSTE
jgi:hypothetical protein